MGAGIALFKQLFPEDYYAYQTATLISSKPVAKKVVGVNQWSEEWELGTLNVNDGSEVASTSNIRNKGYIDAFPNTTYYFVRNNIAGNIFEYDSNHNFIRLQGSPTTFTTSANCRYIRFYMGSVYGTTYAHNLGVNYPATATTYEPYEEHTYPLGSDEIRGLLKVENGQLVAYGDVKGSDGNGTEVFDIVDLGTLDYSMDSTSLFRVTTDIGAKIQSSTSVVANMLCAEYMTVKQDSISNDKVISGLNWGKGVIIHDTDYTDVPTFKTAMSGKYLIYEKATPTAKSYTPFTNPMLCGSTEEFTDSRSVKMFCGHDSIYADNISFAHIDFGQTVTDGTLDVVHGILTPTGGSPVSVTPASIKTFSGVNNVFSNGGGDITAIYLDTL